MLKIDLNHENVIHFIGIGGAGMSGIAEVLLNKGYQISGSDSRSNKNTQRLQSLGASIFEGHDAKQVEGVQLVVVSTAIKQDNPELIEAHKRGILIIQRAQMLAQLMQAYYGIAIAGTHGKTTTTSLVASCLTADGLDPTFVVGGLVQSIGGNAHLGKGKYFVAEADESDASFLYLSPKITIVTNIDADHMDTYGGSFDTLCNTFLKFLDRLPKDGLAILCTDDPVIASLIKKIKYPVITYGFNKDANIQGIAFKQNGIKSYFKVKRKGHRKHLKLIANLQGKHNVLNSLAMIAVATHLGVSDEAISASLSKFQGVGRRFQIYGEVKTPKGEVMLIDDYGHHPREIFATISAVRDIWPKRRLVLVFQPHRYTRTSDLMDDFANTLAGVDMLLLLQVYSAGEEPITGAQGKDLYQKINDQGNMQSVFVDNMDDLPTVLDATLQAGDVLLIQGAGSIRQLAYQLAWNYANL